MNKLAKFFKNILFLKPDVKTKKENLIADNQKYINVNDNYSDKNSNQPLAEIIPVDADQIDKNIKHYKIEKEIEQKNNIEKSLKRKSKIAKAEKLLQEEKIISFRKKNDLDVIESMILLRRKKFINLKKDSQLIRNEILQNEEELTKFINENISTYKKFFTKNFKANDNYGKSRVFYENIFWDIYWKLQKKFLKEVLLINPSLVLELKNEFHIKKNFKDKNSLYEGIRPCLGFCKSRDGSYKYLIPNKIDFSRKKFYTYRCELSNFGWHIASIKEKQ